MAADSPTQTDDRYRIVALLGKGGMGEVYRAEGLKLGQPVALKFVPERVAGDAPRPLKGVLKCAECGCRVGSTASLSTIRPA